MNAPEIINLPHQALVTRARKEFKLHEERRYKPSDKSGAKRKHRINELRESDEEIYDL
jgi:hypothetical protein